MKKRLITLLMSAVMLCSMLSVGVSALTPQAPSGVQKTEAVPASGLPYTVSYGTTDGKTMSASTAFDADAQAALQSGCEGITTDSATGIPYQLFEIDAKGVNTDNVAIALHAATIQNERMALKVFNVTTSAWDTVDTAVTTGYLSADVALANYADKDGKIKALVMPDYVANGSNRFIWSTDQQHYTKFEDLNETYYGIHHYMVEEYQKDAMAYVINTGDIVDDMPTMSTAAAQWAVADKAFKILDEADVPYGIETGNHDVGDFPANNYTHYLKYFNEDRYVGKPWFGATADNNKSHYDLVTVGNVDFLILYIGYGQGKTKEVIAWCNDVLAMYPHRTAIIATHQYLRPTTLAHEGRADNIHDKVVTQNDNVLMVLSGHYDGAGYKTITLDNGRVVQEVVADYQFVQKESEKYYKDKGVKDPTHSIGSVFGCNGEGYLREIVIDGNTVSMYGFSPITGGEKPFGQRDDISLTVEFPEAQRSITTYRFTAATTGEGDETLTKWTYEDGTSDYAYLPQGAYDAKTATVSFDSANLQTLIDRAAAVKQAPYTADSYQALASALGVAKSAVNGDTATVRNAYAALSKALGALVEIKPGIDRSSLITVHDFDLSMNAWKNGAGATSLSYEKSYVKFVNNENGGFTAQKGASPNNWPDIHYVTPIQFTPVDGKVYLYLDLEAGSTWSLFPVFIQDNQRYTGRLNYIVEGSYNKTFDAGCGKYYGVYDITDALIDLGLDLNKKITLSFIMNVVPGPVTVNEIALLTGEPMAAADIQKLIADTAKLDKSAYTEESFAALQAAVNELKAATGQKQRDAYKKALAAKNALVPVANGDDGGIPLWLIIVLIAAVVVVIGILVFAITYKPKKKPNDTATETSDTKTE